nr:signal peptidase I [Pseudaestuariivita rosea]
MASCICWTCIWDPQLESFHAVGESMAPTLDVRFCATMRHIDPQEEPITYGDVIGFEQDTKQGIFISRVIAKGGDTIALYEGQVILNGQPLQQVFVARDEIIFPDYPPAPMCEDIVEPGEVCVRPKYRETALTGKSYEIFDTRPTPADFMAEITVPDSYFFVMGDHRDNTMDSRHGRAVNGPGMIALQQVRGIFDGL